MTEPRGSILDILGFDHAKLVALAEGVAGEMLVKAEPVVVGWVQANAGNVVQSLLSKVSASAVEWVNENAGAAVQSLLDELKVTFPPTPPS